MSCSRCGHEVPEASAFCPGCGAAQTSACGACGQQVPAGWAFCNRCGAPLASIGSPTVPTASGIERRLTSVLFADLVGYTTISESRDTEEVRGLLSAYFDTCQTVIKRYGGRVEKFIGDAVMAVWGVPSSHEDDAERAVRAGIELVEQVRALGDRLGIPELALRVGVVTGEVTANLGATDQGMVAGDPVNTAARVQSTAAADEVWVDAQTRALTTAAVTYLDMGDHVLKGKAEPVRLYRAGAVVAAVGGLQRVDGLEAPLVGRDREMRLLKELFHAVEETGRPQLVVLDGEAGIGKSRLGWEFEKYVDGLNVTVRWHRGRCLSYGDGVAFWALAEMVRSRIGLLEEDAGATVIMGLDRLLDDVVPDQAERDWLRPRMASLLGEESREFDREDLFGAWARFFERVAAGNPLVMLIDDAEHLDDGLADFLDFLLESSRSPCFVLALARPELLAQRPHLGGRRSTPIRVDPLGDQAMARLVDGLVSGLATDVRDQLVSRAEGIPLYAVETVRALIDRDLVIPVDGQYVVAEGAVVDLAAIGAPTSLHALVSSRLDALTAEERRVVSDASVLGESFTREGIRILAGDVPDLAGVLAALTRKELIATEVDRFSAERGQFRFVQSVIRQVAYSTLSRKDRKARHLQVADHLAAEPDRADELAQVIARHLLDAAEASAEADTDASELRARAGGLMVKAADRAAGLGALEDAVRLYQVALECLEDPRSRADTLLAMATRYQLLLRGEGLESASRQAYEAYRELGDRAGAGEASCLRAMAVWFQGLAEESQAIAQEAYDDLADHEGDMRAAQARGRLACQLAAGLVFEGRASEAGDLINEALVLAERVQDTRSFRRAGNMLAIQHSRMGSSQVGQIVLRGLADLARADQDWVGLKLTLNNLGSIVAPSDLQAGLNAMEEGIAAAEDHGMVADDVTYVNLMNYAWLIGAWDRLSDVVDDIEANASDAGLAWAHAQVIRGLWAWAGHGIPSPLGSDVAAGSDQLARILLAGAEQLGKGNDVQALDALREAVRLELSLNALGDDMHVHWPLAMRVAHQVGDLAALAELAEVGRQVDRRALRTDALAGHARVMTAMLELIAPDPDLAKAEGELREGIGVLDTTGHAVWAAHAREDLGRLMLEQGRAEEASVLLDQARAAYEAMGAQTWLARVDDLRVVTT